MKPELKRKWVKALRSGKFAQTKEKLYDGKGYCCLGVLCRVVRPKDYWYDVHEWANVHGDEDFSQERRKELGISEAVQSRLVGMNDNMGKTFSEIADYIEAKL